MKSALLFLLIVGIAWAGLVVWLLLSITGITEGTDSVASVAIYWTPLLAGPLMLIVGSGALMSGANSRYFVALLALGCLIVTAFVLYSSIEGLQRAPLQAPPMYWFYAILLAVMLATDLAGFKIIQATFSGRASGIK